MSTTSCAEGTQKSVIDTMQTRNELYESINYYQYEEKLDNLFARSREIKTPVDCIRQPMPDASLTRLIRPTRCTEL